MRSACARSTFPQRPIIDGDAISASIAAASIVAKVTRDRICAEFDDRYPAYGFARNKGYGTRRHVEALMREGPCEWHRRSFAPLRLILAGEQLSLELLLEEVVLTEERAGTGGLDRIAARLPRRSESSARSATRARGACGGRGRRLAGETVAGRSSLAAGAAPRASSTSSRSTPMACWWRSR